MALGITLLQPVRRPGGGGHQTAAPGHNGRYAPGGSPRTSGARCARFASRALDLGQISQLLWSGDGTSDPRGLRTSPSAGATYPLDLYLVVGERGVTDLPAGVYHYEVAAHALTPVAPGDLRGAWPGPPCTRVG